jgi:MFS family permease
VAFHLPAASRSSANGWITGAALFGIASTHLLFGGLIDKLDWPGAFLTMAVLTAGVGVLWTIYGPRPLHRSEDVSVHEAERAKPNEATVGGVMQVRNLVLLTLSYGAVGYFQYLFFYWMHHYFSDVLRVGTDRSRFYAGIPTLAMAVGMPLGGWFSDTLFRRYGWRVARAGWVGATMATSAALLWCGASTRDPQWSIVWLSLSLGVLGMAEGPFWVTAVEVGGRRGGLSAAIFNTGGNGFGLLAPIATPIISDDLGFGWQAGIAVASIVCVAGAACWFWIDEGGTGGPADEHPFEDQPRSDRVLDANVYQSPHAT